MSANETTLRLPIPVLAVKVHALAWFMFALLIVQDLSVTTKEIRGGCSFKMLSRLRIYPFFLFITYFVKSSMIIRRIL